MGTGDADQARLAKKYIKCEGEPYRPETVTINGRTYIREDLIKQSTPPAP